MSNPRTDGGPKEGKPGETIFVAMTDVLPPQMFVGIVEDDGYLSDDLYQQMDDIRREYARARLREVADEGQ